MATACSSGAPETGMFVREDEPRRDGDVSQILLADALSRLGPAERQGLERTGEVAGFHFSGQTKHCLVIVSLRNDIINHRPSPTFCYGHKTNEFIERL